VNLRGKQLLLLASASPRRRELLERVGIALCVCPVEVDETVRAGESADAYLERIVEDKRVAARALPEAGTCAALLVADTAVIVDGVILGKPADDDEAEAMLAALAGRAHTVATRFCAAAEEHVHAQTVETRVWFRHLDAATRRAYVRSGEGQDKAGSYAIQGVGAMFVRRIEGSYTNVVGLPLCEVIEALEALGVIAPWPVEAT
jgi:septum formation protein